MQWASAISEQPALEPAVAECSAAIQRQLNGAAPDLAVAFVSPHYRDSYAALPGLVRESLGRPLLLGCSGGGIIGNGQEVEQRPALSITAAVLPEVTLTPFQLEGNRLPDLDAGPQSWEELLGVNAAANPQFILLADPFSFPAQNLIMGLDFAYSAAAKIGGLASGGQEPGGNAMFLGDRAYPSGAVGVAMHGNIIVDTVVAQGCRPIGRAMRITQSRRNMLEGLDGETPLTILRGMFPTLSPRDQDLMRHSLFLGVVMDELVDAPQQGDFLIRNVMGMDDHSGALAIGEMLKEGQLVQFHLRDAETSAEDLTVALERYAGDNRENPIHGALLFSCLGRGQYLYGRPNHDTDLFRDKLGATPLGGFFCNGEIGPVSGVTFLHGYTSSFGIFRPRY